MARASLRAVLLLGSLLLPWPAVAAGAEPELAPDRPGSGPPPAEMVVAGSPVPYLHNQLDSASGEPNAWTSQKFEPAYDFADSEAADDFTVPSGEVWIVERVTVKGLYFNGSEGPMPSVDVFFYADDSGKPGELISRQRVSPPTTDTVGDLAIDLIVEVELPRGTYWLSVVARMSFDPFGQWAWDERSVQSGHPGMWRNPLDGFGTGCTDWGTRASCLPTIGVDLLFALEGEVRSEESCNSPGQDLEDPFPPSDWRVYTLESGPGWSDLAGCGETGNYTGGTGDVACASSDEFGHGAFDTRFISPGFGLVGVKSAWVTFRANYQHLTADALDLDLSEDGTMSWTNVLHWTSDQGAFRSTPGVVVRVDLAPYVGRTGLMARWRYYNLTADAFDWYVQIDDITLTCPLFADGFEGGNTWAWSDTVPSPPPPT